MPKTTKEIVEESNFNYMYPQSSLHKIEQTDKSKWYSQSEVDDIRHKSKIVGIEIMEKQNQADLFQLQKEIEQNIQYIAEEYNEGKCQDLDEGLIKLKILDDSTFAKYLSQSSPSRESSTEKSDANTKEGETLQKVENYINGSEVKNEN